jgi:hypothetical protein
MVAHMDIIDREARTTDDALELGLLLKSIRYSAIGRQMAYVIGKRHARQANEGARALMVASRNIGFG